MSDLNILSWNVRGLNNPIKTRKVLAYANRVGAKILMLQESHLSPGQQEGFVRGWGSDRYFSSFASSARGVLTFIHKSLRFHLIHKISDEQGRFLIVTGMIQSTKVTLVNIYAPNIDTPDFFLDVMNKCHGMMDSLFNWGGDHNTIIDVNMDRTSSSPRRLSKSADTLVDLWEFFELGDAWRQLHNDEREYSYYSTVHDMSSRIDFIVMKLSQLHLITKCEYPARTLSDHSPILLRLRLPDVCRCNRRWRFKPEALTDLVFSESLREEILSFFPRNLTSVS